jgi:hydrogenase nickel incorporation protein HypA/HybF
MHELSLCRALLDTLEQGAAEHGYRRVTGVRLEIGPFAAVDAEALRFAFEVARADTLAAGAWLEILTPRALARCGNCGREVEPVQRFDPCPHCGGYALELLSGDALRIKELEVA